MYSLNISMLGFVNISMLAEDTSRVLDMLISREICRFLGGIIILERLLHWSLEHLNYEYDMEAL